MTQIATRNITLGDTLDPINAVLYDDNGNPIDLSIYTVKFAIENDSGTEVLAETATGITSHPTQTFTAEADDDYLTKVGHGVQEGDQVVVANSGGALPTGLSASTPYFAIDVTPNKFRLSAVPGGAKIDLTTDGTGTNTFYVVGSVQMDLSSTEVDEAGTFRGWFVRISGSEKRHHPDGEDFIRLNIKTRGN